MCVGCVVFRAEVGDVVEVVDGLLDVGVVEFSGFVVVAGAEGDGVEAVFVDGFVDVVAYPVAGVEDEAAVGFFGVEFGDGVDGAEDGDVDAVFDF